MMPSSDPDATTAPAESPLHGGSACGDETRCAICCEDMDTSAATLRWPTCRHVFHSVCAMTAVQYDVRCPLCRGQDPGLRAREVTLHDVLRDFLPVGGDEPSFDGGALLWTPTPSARESRTPPGAPPRLPPRELFPGMSASAPFLPLPLPLPLPQELHPANLVAPSPPSALPASALSWPWFDEVENDASVTAALTVPVAPQTPLRNEARLLLLSPAPRRRREATTPAGGGEPGGGEPGGGEPGGGDGDEATTSILLVRHSMRHPDDEGNVRLPPEHPDHLALARAERRRYTARRRRVLRTDSDLMQRHERVRREERDVSERIRAIESHYAALTREVWRTDPTLLRMRRDYRRARNAMSRHRRDLRVRLHAHLGDDPWEEA